MRRFFAAVGLIATLVVGLEGPALAAPPVADEAPVVAVTPVTPSARPIAVSLPRKVKAGLLTAITLTVPGTVAAFDGRVLVDRRAATLVGVAIHGKGTGLRPVAIRGGFTFGAYGLAARGRATVVDLVLLPRRSGRIAARVIVDSAATRSGDRVAVAGALPVARIAVGRGARSFAVPAAGRAPVPSRVAGPTGEALVDGRIDARDLDVARAEWERSRLRGAVCGPDPRGDVNADGCMDIVDLQATLASKGRRLRLTGDARLEARLAPRAAVSGSFTFTVTSGADTPDASRGDGVCADSQGRCTLRAAIAEADTVAGNDRIEFNIPGTAPVVIQIGSRLPYITSRAGTLTIDGYTQPGSRVNSAEYGSNAIPGIDLRGNGASAKEVGIYITSSGNTVRGLAMGNLYRGVFLDGVNAFDNRIIGNWIGFRGDGTSWPFAGYGILLNTGSHDNQVGTPKLADRNVIGNWTAAVDSYGPGTDRNVIRNNLLCIRPDGATAICNMGVDYNFGPKDGIVGGDDPFEANVIGPTYNQGIEISHGWDPAKVDTSSKWQITGNRVTGNWVGFRMNGSYAANYRSGQHFSSSDNGNGINVYDGTYDNIVQRNHVASVYDGIQVMAPNAQRNIVRGNIIGVSPTGQAAPLQGWGVKVRWGTRYDVIANNTIRNAASGGIGLVSLNNQGQPMSLAFNIRLSRNVVSNTNGPAIFLAADPADPSTGANLLIPAPRISDATTSRVSGTAVAGATVEVYRASRPAGESGLPVEFLGDTVVAGDGTWSVPVSGIQDGDRVAALQIRADDNTSPLSDNSAVGGVILPPPAPDPVAQDGFGRQLSGDWGDAAFGGTWNLSGSASDYSVGDGVGSIRTTKGQGREARLQVSAKDLIVTGTLRFDRVPAGGNAFAYLLARVNGTTAYRATIRVSTSGAVFLQLKRAVNGAESNIGSEVAVSGLTITPGTPIAFRYRIEGDQQKLRVWPAAAAEPSAWGVTGTDSTSGLTAGGGVGLRTYTGSSVTNGPITVSLDDYQALLP
jgi:CSLREA domain-containing protein